MKVSFFVSDLHSNPIVRAGPLADAARQLGHQVEVLGFLRQGGEIYAPYRQRYRYKTLPYQRFRDVLSGARRLASMAEGEVVYACKPNWDTLLPAALASGLGRRKPLLLDVEDNELWAQSIPTCDGWQNRLRRAWLLRHRLAAHGLLRICRHRTTVVSRALQRRYGGVIVLHGPDQRQFDPARPELERGACRRRLELPAGVPLLVFAGRPHPHKGVDLMIDALDTDAAGAWHLVLAGDPQAPEFQQARRRLGQRCHLLGTLPYEQMPGLLGAVDAVATLQRRNDFTECQIPAKLLEGMGMARAVIGTRVSDMPLILGEGEPRPRGWVVDDGSVPQVAAALVEIAADPAQTARRGDRAREYFLQHASTEAIAARIGPLLSFS
jgi:glycosyltransferase involved in cell wall biosynthesis